MELRRLSQGVGHTIAGLGEGQDSMDRRWLLSLATVLMSTSVGCQGGGVRGVVRDPDEKPLAGAKVTWADKEETATAVTAQDGSFQVRLGKVGPFTSGAFTVSLEGYQAARDDIGDGPYECVVTMQPKDVATGSIVRCRNME